MRILAWDTSTKVGLISWMTWDNGQISVQAVHEIPNSKPLSENLLPSLQLLTKKLDWQLSEIDLFAVGIGPGSFTGIRIGLATAKALGYGYSKKVIPFSSLEIWSLPSRRKAKQEGIDGLSAYVRTACLGEVYLRTESLFKNEKENTLKTEERCIFEEDLKELQKSFSCIEIEEVSQLPGKISSGDWETLFFNKDPSKLALPQDQLHAAYLRAPDATIKLEKGLIPRHPTENE